MGGTRSTTKSRKKRATTVGTSSTSTRDRLRKKMGKCPLAQETLQNQVQQIQKSVVTNPEKALSKIDPSAMAQAIKMLQNGEGLPDGLSLDTLTQALEGTMEVPCRQDCRNEEEETPPPPGSPIAEESESKVDDQDFYESVFEARTSRLGAGDKPVDGEHQMVFWKDNKFVLRTRVGDEWVYSIKNRS
jgi:hypothetical protein